MIDTPGIQEMGVETTDLSCSFFNIDKLAQQCRFANCTHTGESGCAVLAALANEQLEQLS